MAGLASILGIVGTVAQIGGTIVGAAGQIASGEAAKKDAEFQAQQLDIRGKQEFAAAQYEARQVARNTQLARSAIQARSAASGLGPTDATVLNTEADVASYGKEQELLALAVGEMSRRQAEYQAQSLRTTGQASATGAYYGAAGTILGGLGNIFAQKYGNGGYTATAGSSYGAMSGFYGV